MGYELYRHVLDHAPELDATARLVLAVIADDANDRTRLSYIPNEVLAHRCGVKPEAIRKALGRLAKAGYEIRVPIGKDVNGDPVFAARGHRRATYAVPVFPERPDLPQKPGTRSHLSEEEPPESREQDPTFTEKAGNTFPASERKVGTGSQKVGTGSHPSPQSPHASSKEEASPLEARNDDHDTSAPSTKTTKRTAKAEADDRTDIERVCTHLRQRVIDNGKPAHLVTITEEWRTAARLLIDRDGVTEEQIHRAIDWVQDHDFWRVNVRAMPKLRTKYFELRDEAQRDRGRTAPPMTSQRTAERCSEHHMVLPCGGCIGEINAGDPEIPLRLLAEHGPQARPDLAQRLNGHGATA